MIVTTIPFSALDGGYANIDLGRAGENKSREILFDISDWLSAFPHGSAQLLHQRENDTAPYPCLITERGNFASWIISDVETEAGGTGKGIIHFIDGVTVVKSAIFTTKITPGLSPAGDVPAAQQSWVDDVLTAAVEAKNSKNVATEQAGIATTQAGISTTKADEAYRSAAAAKVSEDNAYESEVGAAEEATKAETAARNALLSEVAAADEKRAAEEAQSKAETAQIAAKTAQSKAETAQMAAELAAQNTANDVDSLLQDYVTDAQTAKTAAETAQGKAEDAQAAAEQVVIDTKTLVAENTSEIKNIESALINSNPNAETRLTQTTYDRIISLPKNAGEGGLKSVFNGNTLKNETTYNRDTWAEWTKSSGVVGNASGLILTATNGVAVRADLSTQLKNNTKYGLIYNIVLSDLSSLFIFEGYYTGSQTFLSKNVGSNIHVFTTQSTIISNKFRIQTGINNTTGTTIKIKDIRIFELPAGSQIETDFTNLTADQLAARYPYIDGVKSVVAPRVKSVGKNLFDNDKNKWKLSASPQTIIFDNEYTYISGTGNAYSSPFYLSPGTYTFQIYGHSINASSFSFSLYDIASASAIDPVKYIATSLQKYTNTVTVVSYGWYCFRLVIGVVGMTAKFKDVQIERGSVATTYETCKESFLYSEPITLNRLPNSVYDEISDRKYIQRTKEYMLQSNDITNFYTSNPDYDYVSVRLPIDCDNSVNIAKRVLLPSYSLLSHDSANRLMGVIFAKGTTFLAAKEELTGKKIWYQLATPITIENVTSGAPISYPSGTIYLEPALADASVYTDKISVLLVDFPIQSLETIYKVNSITGEQIPLDISVAVISEDKLSFIHPALAENDIAFFTYFYDYVYPYGENIFSCYDSRYVIADSVNGKVYKWSITSANGVASLQLTEVI